MPDQLYLSVWVRGFEEQNMLRHFTQFLNTFPFSQLRPGISGLKIYALELVEPPLLERDYASGAPVDTIIETAKEFENADSAYIVNGYWEQLDFEADSWALKPSRVSICCFGPSFDNYVGDHLRIELGNEAPFLPQPEIPDSIKKVQANIKSLLRLTHEVRSSLPVTDVKLWSESGENFAERLAAVLDEEF